jgi:hypothetical protein
MEIPNKEIRLLAIRLLDDEDGINLKAARRLDEILRKSGNIDIADAVEIQQDRAFLNEGDVSSLITATK